MKSLLIGLLLLALTGCMARIDQNELNKLNVACADKGGLDYANADIIFCNNGSYIYWSEVKL